MVRYVRNWVRRTVIAFRGFQIWLKVGYPFALLPAVFLLVIWLMGYGWLELAIVLSLGMVLVIAEMFNYAIEKLCNKVLPNTSEDIRVIKDICAGAVLVSGLVLIIVFLYIIL